MSNAYFVVRESCPGCGSANTKTIYEQPFSKPPISDYLNDFYASRGKVEFEYLEGSDYILNECNSCGMIFQKEIPNDELMDRLYGKWLDPEKALNDHNKRDGLSHYIYYAQEVMQLIAYFKKRPSQLKFFDFGMGWGRWALMAKAFGCVAYGSELSKDRIEHAKSNGIKVIEWDDFPNYKFDFINTEQVFEHIPEPLVTLRHLKKALAPEGLIKISVPTANDIERRLNLMDWKANKYAYNSLNPVAPLEHINFYRRNSIVKMAEVVGLKEVLIPIKTQYQYTTEWDGIKKIAKNFYNPVSKNVLKKLNYLFFKIA